MATLYTVRERDRDYLIGQGAPTTIVGVAVGSFYLDSASGKEYVYTGADNDDWVETPTSALVTFLTA